MVNNYFALFQSLFSEELRIAEELRAQITSVAATPPACWAWAINPNGEAEACFWEANGIYFLWCKHMILLWQWNSTECRVTIKFWGPWGTSKTVYGFENETEFSAGSRKWKENARCVHSVVIEWAHAQTLVKDSV